MHEETDLEREDVPGLSAVTKQKDCCSQRFTTPPPPQVTDRLAASGPGCFSIVSPLCSELARHSSADKQP